MKIKLIVEEANSEVSATADASGRPSKPQL